jgi:type II secretory pathway pseudopilin PulG
MKKKLTNHSGFTLVEVMFVTGIMVFVLVSMLSLFIHTTVLAEMSGNKTLAVAAAQTRIEEIRRHNYDYIAVDYASGGTPGDTFEPAGLDGIGLVTIGGDAELRSIDVRVFWRDRYDRIVGEDLDLDGVLDSGEDKNGNGALDSPVRIQTLLTRR